MVHSMVCDVPYLPTVAVQLYISNLHCKAFDYHVTHENNIVLPE